MILAPILIAAALSPQPGAGTSPVGRQPIKPEPIPVSALRVFTDARDAARKAPIAERLAITIKEKDRTPVTAAVVLRIAPGVERDQHDAAVSIEAGELRVYTQGGELTAAINSNPATFYRAAYGGTPGPAMLKELLQPMPLPTLAIYFAPDGQTVSDPTPQTRGISWQPTALLPSGEEPITLAGTIDGKPGPAIVFDRATYRLRSFTAPLGEERTLTITATPTDPGDPKTWPIDVSKRTRVAALKDLGTKPEPARQEPPAEKTAEPVKPGPQP